MTVERLIGYKYVYGVTKVITTVGIAAVQHGHIARDIFTNLGCYPFVTGYQTQTSEYVYQEQQQTQVTTIIGDLVHTGYLYQNYLISRVGYYAITKSYFSVEHFRYLNVWPYRGIVSINAFIAAGYAAYSGYLTTFGTQLLHARYFTFDMVASMGMHLHDDCAFYHHALIYGGYLQSSYHETHVAMHSAAGFASYEGQAVQVGIFIVYLKSYDWNIRRLNTNQQV